MAPALSAARCLCHFICHALFCVSWLLASKYVSTVWLTQNWCIDLKKREKKSLRRGKTKCLGARRDLSVVNHLDSWCERGTAARSSHTSCQAPTACGKCRWAAHQKDSTAKTNKSIMTSPQGHWTLIRVWRLFALSAEMWPAANWGVKLLKSGWRGEMFVKRSLNPAYAYLVNGW